jgi:hypothetical protein
MVKENDKKFYEYHYITLDKSARVISKEIGCDAQTVLNRLKKLGITIKSNGRQNEKNHNWKENVGRSALHEWIGNHKPKLKICEHCKNKKPLELANISGKYLRNIDDYKWLCRSCHEKYDFENGIRKPYIRGSLGHSSAWPVCGSAEYGPARRG